VFGMTNDRLRADVCMHTHRGTWILDSKRTNRRPSP
jgi:hypothetical protein